MKKLLILITILFAQLTMAHDEPIFMIGHPVDAKIEIEYYKNMMPGGFDIGNKVFAVHATVEFCRTVEASDFALQAFTIPAGNLLQLYTTQDAMVDCFGPTHPQTFTYSLPKNADPERLFYSADFVPTIYSGEVH